MATSNSVVRACSVALILLGSLSSAAVFTPSTGVDQTGIDLTVRPGDDFYRYANGAWLSTVAIPTERVEVGVQQDLAVVVERQVAELLGELCRQEPKNLEPDFRRLTDVYRAALNTSRRNREGLLSLMPEIHHISSSRAHIDIARGLARAARVRVW